MRLSNIKNRGMKVAIYKTESGKWEARISYRDEQGKVKSKRKRFNLKREALDYESTFLKSLDAVLDESMTFNELLTKFLENKAVSVKEDTLRDQELLLLKFTDPIKHKKMKSLKQSDYFKIFDNIVSSDYSWSRKNRAIILLKSVSKYANTRHNYPDMARNLETLKKNDGDEQVFSIWTPEHFNQFIENVDNYTLKAMFVTLYFTGMRRGEARALLKTDLNTYDRTLSITKAIRRNVVDRLKTASSRRTIKLDNRTFEMLLPLLETEGDYLFGGLESVSNSMLQRAFTRGKSKLDIPDIRIHDLRHSHASVLINNGANIVAVSKRLGHSDINTTLRTYTHLMQNSDDELMSIIDAIK